MNAEVVSLLEDVVTFLTNIPKGTLAGPEAEESYRLIDKINYTLDTLGD